MKNILVVDNNPMLLEFMAELLDPKGYHVLTAESGLAALRTVETVTPDLVFVDLIMPQIGGTELLRLLRNRPELEHSYLVILSAIAAEEPDFDFSDLADAYLAKVPFKHMGANVLNLLEDLTAGRTEEYRRRIVGLDQIYRRDITKELLFSRHHMETMLSGISDGFVELSENHQVIFVNDAAARIFEMSREELLTSDFPALFPAETSQKIADSLQRLGEGKIELGRGAPVYYGERQLNLRINPVRYKEYRSLIVLIQDITEQVRAERIIRDDLKEKETLLREVHHRVKNNLNVVASLLSLQTNFLEDPQAGKHLIESKNRVESMALIHEKLYNTEDLSGVFLDSYLKDLITHLLNSYGHQSDSIETTIDIPEVHLDLSLAVPLGLIINELLTNSLEHGLTEQGDGQIEIRLESDDHEGRYRLLIRDNGPGIPDDLDPEESDTLGLLLVSSLAQQIHGSFELKNDRGALALIEFQKH
ncbi:MAG TPA: response regulator [Sediminispirochaeta sp.]|nr:response regulator [Sediminispirochaeta sp.]